MEKKLLGYDASMLNAAHAIDTASEIHQQPAIWLKVCDQLAQEKDRIQCFLDKVRSLQNLEIILTGAGTSAFAGEVVEPILHESTEYHVRAIATTDIVGNPLSYLSPNKPTLLISYARSGNSPESVATVELANQLVKNIYHIIITCNREGALAKLSDKDDKTLCLLMPEETNDKSFAMTSSCTSMILTNYLIFNLNRIDEIKQDIEKVQQNLNFLFQDSTAFTELMNFNFNRFIILGSGSLRGIAREMALKTLELTAGVINANYDTPLGFRHGPKSVIDPNTLTIILKHNKAYASLYDEDLTQELKREEKLNKVVVLRNDYPVQGDYYFEKKIRDELLLGLQYLVFGQILALKKSLQLGLTPDNPCPTGEVNRVVKGVMIHSYKD